jgi:hypothetical protein
MGSSNELLLPPMVHPALRIVLAQGDEFHALAQRLGLQRGELDVAYSGHETFEKVEQPDTWLWIIRRSLWTT